MARTRRIYQTDLLYVGPTGYRSATGTHNPNAVYGNILSATSGVAGATSVLANSGYIAQLHRIQKIDHNWSKSLTDVNQFGELAAFDRVGLEPPTVGLTYSYLLSNFVNEDLMGLSVAAGSRNTPTNISCLSGILASVTDQKNYFLKTVAEGQDASDLNPATYDVVSFGNGYISSVTWQGSVGSFPTADVTVAALNAQMQSVTHAAGAMIPAVNQADGSNITGWGYALPTGLTSFANAGLTNNQGISVLRPGDITLSLGVNAGDGFAQESDIKVQSFNVSVNTNQEDIQKLGSKYAYAKVPRFPVQATMTVNAILGEHQTGSLVEIVDDNKDFNPSITITKPGDSTTTICYFKLAGAKLDNQSFSHSIGQNATVDFTFSSQIGSSQDLSHGLFLSGVVA